MSVDLTDFETGLLKLQEMYSGLLCLHHGSSFSRQKAYLESQQKRNDPFKGNLECWHLDTLAVDPTYQRRGIGTKLMAWGLEQSREENLPITLYASPAGLRLYKKLGFIEVQVDVMVSGTKETAMAWTL